MIASNRTLAYVACRLSLRLATSAGAKEIQVQMKNSGKEGMMVFEPSFIKASVGNVLTFLPTNRSHNAQIIATIAPKARHSVSRRSRRCEKVRKPS
jgi:plastocyanin